jgi:hypothetical protein
MLPTALFTAFLMPFAVLMSSVFGLYSYRSAFDRPAVVEVKPEDREKIPELRTPDTSYFSWSFLGKCYFKCCYHCLW